MSGDWENRELPGGSRLKEPYIQKEDWQIWKSDRGNVLLAASSLVTFWEDRGLIEPGLFLPMEEDVFSLEALEHGFISSVEDGPWPESMEQIRGIAEALHRTRLYYSRADLGRAIYVSRLPWLLFPEEECQPSSSDQRFRDGAEDAVPEDAWILGRWVTQGLNVPFTDEARVMTYAHGMTENLYLTVLRLFEWKTSKPGYIQPRTERRESAEGTIRPQRKRRREGEFELAGRPEAELFFREEILDIIDRQEEYERMGVSFPGPTLLIGPPGCGKTYAVERLGEYLGWPVYYVNAGTVASSYIHETSRMISDLFTQAIRNAPAMVVMDEMEAYLSKREGLTGTGGMAHNEEIAEFLRMLPRLAENRVLLFAMTNLPDALDPAVIRKGRFDHTLTMDYPTVEELEALLACLLREIPKESGLNLRKIAVRLRNRPISDVDYVVKEAGRLAVRSRRDRVSMDLLQEACDRALAENGQKDRKIGFGV